MGFKIFVENYLNNIQNNFASSFENGKYPFVLSTFQRPPAGHPVRPLDSKNVPASRRHYGLLGLGLGRV